MLQTCKILQHNYDLDEGMFFKTPTDNRTRGHSYKVNKERTETSTRRNYFSCRVIDNWNDLPDTVVTSPNREGAQLWIHFGFGFGVALESILFQFGFDFDLK